MVNRIRSGTLDGIDGCGVIVEIDVGRGLPSFQIVGLPNAAVRESRERVMAAVRNSGFSWPQGRVVISLVPADMPKVGASLDLAIAVGICTFADTEKITKPWQKITLLGELSLSGALRPIRGLLAMVLDAARTGCEACVVPHSQAREVALVEGIDIIPVANLEAAVIGFRQGRGPERSRHPDSVGGGSLPAVGCAEPDASDMAFLASLPIRIRRLLELTAAGGHNLLMYGPPGSGKTRLARLIGRLQPPATLREILEISRVHGAAGLLTGGGLSQSRPFRAPHHTITRAGLVGGGRAQRPGEVTLANMGILFLDEIAEFNPRVLDALREPLEERRLLISRANGQRSWPADFQLLAAMNPCRCGLLGSRRGCCRCTPLEINRYHQRLSGPLLDRLDIIVEIEEETSWSLGTTPDAGMATEIWRETVARIARVRTALAVRTGRSSRSRPGLDESRRWLNEEGITFLDAARPRLGLSIRGVLRCMTVARSAAELDKAASVGRKHLAEALQLRGVGFPVRS